MLVLKSVKIATNCDYGNLVNRTPSVEDIGVDIENLYKQVKKL